MSDEEVTCEMCGTALMDLERRLERNDRSHRHHPSDCARILKLKLVEVTRMMHEGVDDDIRFACDILLALGHTEAANHDQIVGLVRAQREAMTVTGADGCPKPVSERLKELVEALRWYADDGNHVPPAHSADGWCRDSGHRARVALGTFKPPARGSDT